MQVCYALSDLPKSIFLAGPLEHSPVQGEWRKHALAALQTRGFEGTVLVPQGARHYGPQSDQANRQAWAIEAARRASAVALWVPAWAAERYDWADLIDLQGLAGCARLAIGTAAGGMLRRALDRFAYRHHVPVRSCLDSLVQDAMALTRYPWDSLADVVMSA